MERSLKATNEEFYLRLAALQQEGFRLAARIGDGDEPMIFQETQGGMVAVLFDREDRIWTWSTREGLVCEE